MPPLLMVELSTDPHGVRIDQLFAHVGATVVAAMNHAKRLILFQTWNSRFGNFIYQFSGLSVSKPV